MKLERIDNIKLALGQTWSEYENLLTKTLNTDTSLLEIINSYVLSNRGKSIRPLLSLLVSNLLEPNQLNKDALVCAVASELIHTATLLHDDVVDESDLRRGASTVRKLYSPGTSVLVGDYWLSRAILVLIENNIPYGILNNFAKTIDKLVEGEMLQMERAQELDITKDMYYRIINCKTAQLFVAAIISPAQALNFPEDYQTALYNYALNLGYSFQVRDDIIDYMSADKTGKDVDSDILKER